MDESIGIRASMHRLLQRIEHEVRLQRGAHAPADDHAREHIDHEGDEHKAAPGGDVGEVRDPQLVRPLATNCRSTRSAGRCAFSSATVVILNALPRRTPHRPELAHQPLHGAARHRDLSRFSCFQVLRAPYTQKFSCHTRWICGKAPASRRARADSRAGSRFSCLQLVVGRWGDRQHLADRLDPKSILVSIE